MAGKATVRWNESAQRWMAWVRFPDGSRRKVERVEKADAQADLNALLAERAAAGKPLPRRLRLASFNELLDEWVDAGCPSSTPGARTRHAKRKAPNTIANAQLLVATHVRPAIGVLWVDRTRTERVEELVGDMAEARYATNSPVTTASVDGDNHAVRTVERATTNG